MKERALSHKEQYRLEYLKYQKTELYKLTVRLQGILNEIVRMDERFDEWYTQNFPDGE
jgi:hypothetical protein